MACPIGADRYPCVARHARAGRPADIDGAEVETAHHAVSCRVGHGVTMKESPEAITQATPVGEASHMLKGSEPVIVHRDDSLHRLAELALERPETRVLSVVDDDGRLIGLIPVRLLVNDIFLKIVPEEFLGIITDVEDVLEYAAHVGARTAGDIMRPPVSVHAEQRVRDAFETMHKARLNGLPVVDEESRVIGYVDQLELLLAWVRASGREPLLRPDDVHDAHDAHDANNAPAAPDAPDADVPA
jgi:CBS domain-containing protein